MAVVVNGYIISNAITVKAIPGINWDSNTNQGELLTCVKRFTKPKTWFNTHLIQNRFDLDNPKQFTYYNIPAGWAIVTNPTKPRSEWTLAVDYFMRVNYRPKAPAVVARFASCQQGQSVFEIEQCSTYEQAIEQANKYLSMIENEKVISNDKDQHD